MSTIVFVHAHPDDEASQTSGTMRLLVQQGHRVVLVYATNGDHGSVPEDLGEGETLVQRRRAEAQCSQGVIGTHRVVWLGYADSGMHGWEQNSLEGSFHSCDTDEAAASVAAVLDEEDADILIGYDRNGGYGHPDHIKVHLVAHRAAELAARRPRLLESTSNRDEMQRLTAAALASGADLGFDPDEISDNGEPLGMPEAELHWQVDLGELISLKRRALACHASQTDVAMMLRMPPEAFAAAFGREHYIEPGRAPGLTVGLFL